MSIEQFTANGKQHKGYLALPKDGKGPGLLLLHAWWGLTDFFTQLADKLASEGFVVFAPDFFEGKTTADIEQAGKQVAAAEAGAQEGKEPPTLAIAKAAYEFLRAHPAVNESKLASIGFSFGAYYAIWLDETFLDAFSHVVLFYGMAGADVSHSNARYLAHFAESDPYESVEAARDMHASNLRVYIYPDTGHWFFEHNRPDAYNADAAKLAWERSVEFLKH